MRRLSRWGTSTVKIGAMGCIGVAHQSGIGIAAKSWSGEFEVALMGAIAMIRHLGLLSDYPYEALADSRNPPVLGGGHAGGCIRSAGRLMRPHTTTGPSPSLDRDPVAA